MQEHRAGSSHGLTPSSAQPPKWTKASPLPARGEQGDSLKPGFLSSGLQPGCNGWKPRDAISQRAPRGDYRPCSTEQLNKAAEPQPPAGPGTGKQEEQQAAFFPEQFWQLHRFPGNINNCTASRTSHGLVSKRSLPRICPISASYFSANAESIKEVAQGNSPPAYSTASSSLALTLCQRPSSLDLQCRAKAAPSLEACAGAQDAQPLPRPLTGLQGAWEHRQARTDPSLHHTSLFFILFFYLYSYILQNALMQFRHSPNPVSRDCL